MTTVFGPGNGKLTLNKSDNRFALIRQVGALSCSQALFPGLLEPLAQRLTSACSISLNLHVVNFAHLDGLVLRVYDWRSLDQFPDLIEGADLNGE